MSGRQGQVTIQLPYPVSVNAVTVDHVSKLLIGRMAGSSSAPKKIRVFGYPACSKGCKGKAFDERGRHELMAFEYDMNGRSMQTFEVAAEVEPECSETTPVCSAPGLLGDGPMGADSDAPVVAVTVEVLENWGADYTCLYRLRIHGNPT